MKEKPRPARVVPPGRIVERELEAREWTQKDLAQIMGRPVQTINQIIGGIKQITIDTALELADAFGTSPELWVNLESDYRLHLSRQRERDPDIAIRSKLYSVAPISEMIKNGWIQPTDQLDDLVNQICDFLGISSLDQTPQIVAQFRHTKERGPELLSQIAWVRRVQSLTRLDESISFDRKRLESAISDILRLAENPHDVRKLPTVLYNLGIRFVIVPHLAKTYIDGATLDLDSSPIVALTLRYDRLDTFWFTLMHEIGHIVCKHHGVSLDNIDQDEGLDDTEHDANEIARNWLIESKSLKHFINTHQPRFSRAAIEQFGRDQRRHPSIVLGRLQYEGKVRYSHLRDLHVKVKPYLTELVDQPLSSVLQ